jgi:hypothetical protein
MVPPGGWTLAHKAGATIVDAPSATIAVTTYDRMSKSPSRDDVLRDMAARVGVDLPSRKGLLKRPQKREPVGGVTLSFYQFDKTRRSQQNGTLVVFITDSPSNAAVLGMAFVADHDKSSSDEAVRRAIESLQPPAAPVVSPERPVVQKARLQQTEPTREEPNYGLDLHPLSH